MATAAGLGARERQIMDSVYRRGQATVAEVMADLPDPPTYSGVRAMLRLLEEKGHLVHRQDGPRYVYLPAVPSADARTDALRHVVRTFFEGSPEEAMVALLRMGDSELGDDELERLVQRVRAAAAEGR